MVNPQIRHRNDPLTGNSQKTVLNICERRIIKLENRVFFDSRTPFFESQLMSLQIRPSLRILSALLFGFAGFLIAALEVPAQKVAVTMEDGMVFEGRVHGISGFGPNPASLIVTNRGYPILMVDDGLRRVFVNNRRRVAFANIEETSDSFEIWQGPIFETYKNFGVGPIVNKTPFSEFGRRVITMVESDGSREMYAQGIVEITPDFVKVQGLHTRGKNRFFDMRFATSSIDKKVIAALLRRQIKNPDSITERNRLVAFFVKADMFEEADAELKAMAVKFPGLKKENKEKRETLKIQIHRRALEEIRFRFDAGQVRLASSMWDSYPDKASIPGEIGAEFLELKTIHIDPLKKKLADTKKKIDAVLEAAAASDDFDAGQKRLMGTFKTEIENNLNPANVDRFSTFIRFVDDETLSLQQKAAYAISSWFVGSTDATNNFAVAVAFPHTRGLIREYLTTADEARRVTILDELTKMETGTPQAIAAIIRNLTPLFPPPAGTDLSKPMRFEIPVVATRKQKPTVEYFVQLPPEYNPHKKYPCIVTLPTTGFSAEKQLTWWTGSYIDGLKIHSGPASRHGYIVISPNWWSPGQGDYSYSIHEHDCVLASLRDAKRRFSIDTDKVFLSGHFKGGDAAWDIGVAHPDLWAGVIPVSGRPDKFVLHYHETAHYRNIPYYLVTGDRDYGIRAASNGGDHSKSVFFTTVQRWLLKKEVDLTLVEYQGRGPEDFFEEIHHIFRWMKNKKRKWVPQSFNGRALRTADNFFWNFEIGSMPAQQMVAPVEFFDVKRDTFKISVERKPVSDPKVGVRFKISPGRIGEDISLWLGPEFVDFTKLIEIGGRGSFKKAVQPSRRVILEDVRLRGDRQHPFWARLHCKKTKWVEKK